MEATELLAKTGLVSGRAQVSPFLSEEDGTPYAIWKVTAEGQTYVLKEAKGCEPEIYATFLRHENRFAPRLYGAARYQDKVYLLMEYIPGQTLRRCSREKLALALDALMEMQALYWEKQGLDDVGRGCEKSLPGRISRGEYLRDEALEKAYEEYLRLYAQLPRTFCHDDLLPFNVLVSDTGAAIIDWECAGMLPYLTSLARLLAHGEEEEAAFFYMTGADREFAIDYYYDRLVKARGIPYGEYRRALDYFFLYEYCEWVMLGEKYGDTETQRYLRYRRKAKQLAQKLNYSESMTFGTKGTDSRAGVRTGSE